MTGGAGVDVGVTVGVGVLMGVGAGVWEGVRVTVGAEVGEKMAIGEGLVVLVLVRDGVTGSSEHPANSRAMRIRLPARRTADVRDIVTITTGTTSGFSPV